MRRTIPIWLITRLTLALGLGLVLQLRAEGPATNPAALESLSAIEAGSQSNLELKASGPFSFRTHRIRGNLVWFDLQGLRMGSLKRAGSLKGSLVGYRILEYEDDSGGPVVRVHVMMRQPQKFVVRHEGNGLLISFLHGDLAGDSAPTADASTKKSPSARILSKRGSRRSTRVEDASNSKNLRRLYVVGVERHDDGEGTQIKIRTSRPATYKVLRLANPSRLVIDLMGARSRVGPIRTFPFRSQYLERVRLAQFRPRDPAVVRVVADLAGDPSYRVKAVEGGVQIALSDPPRKQSKKPVLASVPKPKKPTLPLKSHGVPESTSATAEKKRVDRPGSPEVPPVASLAPRSLQAKPEPAGIRDSASPVEETLLGLDQGKVEKTKREMVHQDSRSKSPEVEKSLPPSAPSPSVTAAVKPLREPDPHAIRAARAARTLAGSLAPASVAFQDEPSISESESEPQVPPRAAPFPRAAQAVRTEGETPSSERSGMLEEESPRYTGEPISLNLKDVDLKDFFRLIHEISGLNLIIDPNVIGNVTLILDSVPWDQALSSIPGNAAASQSHSWL